jgi:hypothetical protein
MDPDAVFALLAALVTIARRDAKRGNAAARAFLAELEAARPRSVRLLQG